MPRDVQKTIRDLYAECPHLSWESDLLEYGGCGHVHVTSEYVLLARRIGDGWFIRLAIGEGLAKFWEFMPYELPYIGWAREAKGRPEVVWYRTSRLRKLTYEKSKLVLENRSITGVGVSIPMPKWI